MAHYLVHLGAGDGEPSRIQDNPREYLNKLRSAADETNGRLDVTWFIHDGSAIVAVFHSTDPVDVEAFRETVARVETDHQLTMTRLLTLRELGPRLGEEPAAGEAAQAMDAVDLGSDLSFPASDPPSWLWEYARTQRDSAE